MENEENALKELEPHELTVQELRHPDKVITQLFDFSGAEYYRFELWETMKVALSNTSWTLLSEPGTVLYLQKNLGRLIDACWLLLRRKESEAGEIEIIKPVPGSEEYLCTHKNMRAHLYPVINTHKGRIRRLTTEEIENPYLALKAFFLMKGPKDWKKVFSEWAEYSLSKDSIVFEVQSTDIIIEFEQFEKLLETAWLFNKEEEKGNYRESEEEELKAILETYNRKGKKYISRKLFIELKIFLETVPPKRLNRNIRKIFFNYLLRHTEGFPVELKECIPDLYQFSQLLDVAEEETRGWYGEERESLKERRGREKNEASL